MIISLCGNKKETGDIIKELEKVHDIVIFDYFKVRFQTVIEYQRVYYELLDSLPKKEIPKEMTEIFMIQVTNSIKEKREEFSTYIDNKVFDKINEFLNNNQDKIVVIVSNNNFMNDIYRKSNLEKNSGEKIDVKRLIKL